MSHGKARLLLKFSDVRSFTTHPVHRYNHVTRSLEFHGGEIHWYDAARHDKNCKLSQSLPKGLSHWRVLIRLCRNLAQSGASYTVTYEFGELEAIAILNWRVP